MRRTKTLRNAKMLQGSGKVHQDNRGSVTFSRAVMTANRILTENKSLCINIEAQNAIKVHTSICTKTSTFQHLFCLQVT